MFLQEQGNGAHHGHGGAGLQGCGRRGGGRVSGAAPTSGMACGRPGLEGCRRQLLGGSGRGRCLCMERQAARDLLAEVGAQLLGGSKQGQWRAALGLGTAAPRGLKAGAAALHGTSGSAGRDRG
jgi:hypothetical protein